MKFKLVVLFLNAVVAVGVGELIEEAFVKHECIPDVLTNAPHKELTVSYKGGEKAALGNELVPSHTQEWPDINYEGSDGEYYTLLVVDPDAPSRKHPKFREILHCLVVNIPGNKVSDGEVKASYMGPAPPKRTGKHRYIFFIFKQPEKLTFDEPKFESIDSRKTFSAKKFAEKYGLGQPEYGNFFQAQHEGK